MTFERTGDLDLVATILTDPRCWRRMASDRGPSREGFRVEFRPGLHYVVARDESGAVLALFVLKEVSGPAAAEVHFCFRPAVWGSTEDVARAFVAWVWREFAGLDELVGPVPGYNRLALRLAKRAGFRETSRAIGELRKDGKQYDRIIVTCRRAAEVFLCRNT